MEMMNKKKWFYPPTKFSDGPSGGLTRLGAKNVKPKAVKGEVAICLEHQTVV